MILQNITHDRAKLVSYYDAYTLHPEAVLAPYLNAKNRADPEKFDKRFPIFLDRVFRPADAKAGQPHELIDVRLRRGLNEKELGRILFLERIDKPDSNKSAHTRLFLVWLSPALVAQFKSAPPDKCVTPAIVLFHPAGGLDKYPSYWRGNIEPFNKTNFLELGVRYLFKDKHTVLQALAALSPAMGASKLEAATNQLKVMLVVPVSNGAAFSSLSDPNLLEEALIEISRRAYEGVDDTPRIVAQPPPLGRVAVAGYSRSGEILLDLLAKGSKNRFVQQTLREVYAFDVMLDRGKSRPNPRTKTEGYQQFWEKLEKWQGDDSDKLIRLYSSELDTIGFLRTKLADRLRKYGGGYSNPRVAFTSFNGAKAPDGVAFADLDDGFELYSTDNSRSLACLPSRNARVFLSEENKKNDHGFHPDEAFGTNLEGHSWYVSRLFSHALFHSHYW